MFAISTSDYAISKGDRCSSPCATDEERLMFIKNQVKKRKIIEEELQKIPENEKNNLIILMKCLNSDYVEQIIEVKIINEDKKYEILKILNNNKNSALFREFDEYLPYTDASVYPEIWKNFNYTPFIKHNSQSNTNNVYKKLNNHQNKIYLLVPFREKEDAKRLNAKWDNNLKKWYILDNNSNKDLILQKWQISE